MSGAGYPVTRIGFPIAPSTGWNPYADAAPALAGVAKVGASLAVTPGTWTGAPTLRYQLYRGSIADGTLVDQTEAQIEAYALVAGDVGPALRVLEYPIGRSDLGVLSSAVRFTKDDLDQIGAALALFGREGVTLVSTDHVSAQADQSGGGWSLTQATDGNRPRARGYWNGVPCLYYDGNAFALNYDAGTPPTHPTIADILNSGTYAMLAAVWLDDTVISTTATPTAYYKGSPIFVSSASAADLAFYKSGGVCKALHGCYGGNVHAAEQTVTANVPTIIYARKAGTTIYVSVDGAAEASSACDATIGTTEVMATGYNPAGVADTLFKGSCAAIITWASTPGANDLATAKAWLAHLGGDGVPERASITRKKIMFIGDSEVKGANAYQGGWRTVCMAELSRLGYAIDAVGPHTSYGKHRGVDGEKAADVAGALSSLATDLTTYAPDVIVCAHGVNDMGTGTSASATRGYQDSIVAQCHTTRPSATVFVTSCVKPAVGASYGYGGYGSAFDDYNTNGAAHFAPDHWIDMGAPDLDATDLIHPKGPQNEPGGYPSMGLAAASAIASVLGTP